MSTIDWRNADDGDPILYPLFWLQLTSERYANRALRQITGADLTGANLEAWTAKYGKTRESLWYWQYRFEREYAQFERTATRLPMRNDIPEAELAAWRIKMFAELEEMTVFNRLVEAKVVLLTVNDRDYSYYPGLFGPPWKTRLLKEDIFQILTGERLWNDVNWLDREGSTATLDSQMVTRLLLHTEGPLTRDDVPQLQEQLGTTKLQLNPYGRAAWHVGISRLLPESSIDNLDDPETRDGYLRMIIQEDLDRLDSRMVVGELVRVGLPKNAPFLHELFFAERKRDGTYDSVRVSLIDSLRGSPLTEDQRQLLWVIVTDDRYRPIWTYVPDPRKGKGRRNPMLEDTILAINTHVGRDFIDDAERKDLENPEESQATLDLVLAKLRAFEAERAKATDDPN